MEKFPQGSAEPWLFERLGKANTKRRQYYIHCRNHREKLSHEGFTVNKIGGGRSYLGSTPYTKPSVMKTSASALGPVDLDDGENVEDLASTTTEGINIHETDEENALSCPILTDIASPGDDFECPYCFTIQTFNGQRGWKFVFSCLKQSLAVPR
jgi:hypothetical protein